MVWRQFIPPLPSHVKSATVHLTQLERRMQRDRRQALFSHSPPPPRQPAPYRYVMLYDNKVTKYTTNPDGIGATDHPNEATVLRFGVVVPSIMMRSAGSFATLVEFHDWLVKPPERLQSQSIAEFPIVFTHGDITAQNIIVRDGKIYPEYWDYVFVLCGLNVPSLFAKRYDLEYILIGFILMLP
ncbi:hypothetical protein F5Y09DRAFT_354356 [Xylaria sp. FL1042]|nr:hypothetical protein F5Y09DRAFT_354356 [Xylaria sp. FL1042]